MSNYVSLVEDQYPAPVKPPSVGVSEFRPLLADITLYNDDKGKISPQMNVRPSNTKSQTQTQGLSFKEWKMKQEQDVLGKAKLYSGPGSIGSTSDDVLSGVKKQVRFNNLAQTQSLPIIQENAVLPPVIQSTKSLPPNMIQNPAERRMELSICESVLKQQQLEEQQRKLQESQRNMRPLFAGLYQQGDAMHLLQQRPSQKIVPTTTTVQCTCQHHSSSPSASIPQIAFQPPPTTTVDTSRLHEIRTEVLEKRVESLQEQLFLLQQQMSYVLSMHSASSSNNASPVQPARSSNPFLSHMIEDTQKPHMVDSSTQYTILVDAPPTKPEPKPQSDKTFFNQVLGQVNQILDNTDESNNNHIDSRACKFIDSDTSAISMYDPSPRSRRYQQEEPTPKKTTDKSTFMDSLAAKYLTSSGNETQDNSKNDQGTIDVSTTCYNYLKKYDLLKNYAEDDSAGDVFDKQLMKSRQIKLL